jgi:hypothetical protein
VIIDNSDALKIYDALHQAREHHEHRDISNARLHAAQAVRYSPLTSTLQAQCDRLESLMADQNVPFSAET